MSFQDEFVALTCPNCGAPVQITQANYDELFVDAKDGGVIFIGNFGSEEIKCEACDTQFVRKQSYQPHRRGGGDMSGTFVAEVKGGGTIAQGPGAIAAGQGSVVIAGDVRGSTIITGMGSSVAHGQRRRP